MGFPSSLPARGGARRRTGRTGRRPRAGGTVVLGVTGLPASGKSTVAAWFGELGAETVNADRLAHEALATPAVARKVGRALGMEVRRADGSVDRAAVASRVFGGGDPEALDRLASLVHPEVRRGLREAVASGRRRGVPAVVLDVPLLFEGGVDGMCDATVFVDAPRRVRRERARRRGWTDRELRARESRQLPAAERRRRADFVVRNDGPRAATRARVRRVWAAATGRDGGGGSGAPRAGTGGTGDTHG